MSVFETVEQMDLSVETDFAPSLEARATDEEMVIVSFVVPAHIGAVFVDIVAEFACWSPLAMQQRADGSFFMRLRLARGRNWRYRFLIDGERWINDLDADDYVVSDEGCAMSVVST